MRFAALILLAGALGAASALLVSCGGDDSDLIPQRDAEQLKRYADRIGAAVDAQDCTSAARDLQRAQDKIAELPRQVDTGLRQNLAEGFQNLGEQAARECQEEPVRTTPTTPTTPTVPEEEPPAETAPPEEEQPPPEEEQPPPEEEQPPPEGGGEGGGTEAPEGRGAGKKPKKGRGR